jgi:hypothetical protein
MADAVQAVMERMVPELEELQAKGLFSAEEVRAIVARRRAGTLTRWGTTRARARC